MAVSYEKLWQLLDEHQFSLRLFAKVCGITPNTLSRMRQGEYVELGVIDKICAYFDCGYEDVITRVSKEEAERIITDEEYLAQMNIVRMALKKYMEEKAVKVIDLHVRTGLSINTIKAFLGGKNISAMSFLKLTKLGDDFSIQLNQQKENKKMENQKEQKVIFYPAKKIVNVSDVVRINLLFSVPLGRLTRLEDMENYVANKLGVEFIHFDSDYLIGKWKYENHLREIIPHWRTVSVQGWLIDSSECNRERQEKKLIEEGFHPEKCGVNGRSLRIADYKEYLFDFDKELDINYEDLEKKETTVRLISKMK